jgi:hypothetical protein
MAAFFLLVLAIGGGVVVADLARENTTVGEITVFHQTVTGYPEGWLLATAAGLGFVVAVLLVASSSAAKGRARRRQLRRRRPGLESRGGEPEPDHDRLLDEFFGPDETPRHVGRPARPAHLRGDRRQGQARHDQRWNAPERVKHQPEPLYEQASRAAGPHHDTDLPFPARDGRRW